MLWVLLFLLNESPCMSLLPPNASPLQRAFEGLTTRWAWPLSFVTAWVPNTCPLAVLPWLAWAVSVDTWNPQWSEETQRAVVAGSIARHRLKGTKASMQYALSDAGYRSATIDEATGDAYYNGTQTHNGQYSHGNSQGEWANYIVTLDRPISVAQASEVTSLLNTYAPARCKLKHFNFKEAFIYDGTTVSNGTITHGIISN
jgi:phage tail P2-like protein